jgi:coniferyl-aldehyde dehydrogenase
MQEEIFGPLLPVETCVDLDEAIAKVTARPHPLALYYFGENSARRERVLRETMSGGVTINDTLLHFANESLPFGGVGPSGQGAYHGEKSFVLFSNEKPVFTQARLAATGLLSPPYGAVFDGVLGVLNRLKG